MTQDHEIGGVSVDIRPPNASDLPALARFAATVPPHDLLFLARDIRQRRVLQAWIARVEADEIDSLVAVLDGEIIATVASVSDRLSWSPHVWDIRLLVAPDHRNKGLGRTMLERAISRAGDREAAKLTARMTPDQTGAITLFEECGFRAEALLQDQLRDSEGGVHDLAVLFLKPARETARRAAYGDQT